MPLLLVFVTLILLVGSPARAQVAPGSQEDLNRWWSAAGRMWLDETAYEISDALPVQDGICSATLTEGLVIPVWAGRAPFSERMVGFVFVGKGELSVDVPERADRWRIANHAARHKLLPAEQQRAIAYGEQALVLGVDRGLVLSADNKIRSILSGLQPVGGGAAIRDYGAETDGIDEAYIITESKGGFRTKAIATNLLPQRRLQLERASLDPRLWLRQDRLLQDELGMEGEALRFLADWRTTQPLRVVAELPVGLSNDDHDRWLACFRDPMDQEGLGFESLAFAYGTDNEGQRHFERLAGKGLPPPAERPGAWMEAVRADSTVTTRPRGTGNERYVEVDSRIELRAVGGAAQAVTLSMPVDGAVRGTWVLEQLELDDGRAVARVGLSADIFGRGQGVSAARGPEESTAVADQEDGSAPESSAERASTTESSTETETASLGGPSTASETPTISMEPTTSTDQASPESVIGEIEAAQGLGAAEEMSLIQNTPLEYLVQVVLPEPVAEGQTVKLRLRWKARWPYANWSNQGRPLGTTTGYQPILPEPVPSPGGARWDSQIRVGLPQSGLASVEVAVSGSTLKESQEESWFWAEARGRGIRSPGVAVGRWQIQIDPSGSGMPGVRVHLFSNDAWALAMFAPEIRRVVAFLDRFLPSFPLDEVDVWQGASNTAGQVLRGSRPEPSPGMVQIQTVKTSEVTDTSAIEELDPFLTQSMIARQVAQQYWGEAIRPATSRDQWLTEGLSEAFASFYIRAAFGNKAYDTQMAALRELVEDPTDRGYGSASINRNQRFLSLSGATPLSDTSGVMRRRLGAYVLGDTLRLRLGDRAYFSALDQLAEQHMGKTLSTQDLQGALELASGQELDDTFDYFVHGGFIPGLRLELKRIAQPDGKLTLHGCVLSDLPWGRFDVPVEVIDRGGARRVSALVEVVDGRGSFDLMDREGELEALLDPLAVVVAYDRDVANVKVSACESL